MGSARPRLLLLGKNGTGPLVLTGGRPGLYLWINEAADGREWQKVNLAAAHNAAIVPGAEERSNFGPLAPFRFCDAFVNASLATQDLRQGIATLCESAIHLCCSGGVRRESVAPGLSDVRRPPSQP